MKPQWYAVSEANLTVMHLESRSRAESQVYLDARARNTMAFTLLPELCFACYQRGIYTYLDNRFSLEEDSAKSRFAA